jgi:hypothetical protein
MGFKEEFKKEQLELLECALIDVGNLGNYPRWIRDIIRIHGRDPSKVSKLKEWIKRNKLEIL